MIEIKSNLSRDEEITISLILDELKDEYSDFYLTKNNLRLFIKDNLASLLDNVKHGDKVAFCEEGLIIITGFADKANRKYVKLLTKDKKTADKLLKVANWKFPGELYCKLKRNNPLLKVFYSNGYIFKGGRGKELLIVTSKKIREDLIKNKEDKKK